MAVIKCKMCGGDIEISADKTFGTCEYCGSTMTLPKVDDEQRAAAFNRGNHFRRSGEFDKALAVYERIVAEDDNDAEAHWCCALCRFGIEYVEDPATYEWLPTCHRASFDSFLEDVDYLAAVEHSDGITRRQYQKDAAKIAEVQRGILATSQNEQPFDVFLCYKETGEDGQRTRDSLMAQEVYYELTEQGYRVFFARITLEDKAGTEYEPYIFAALNSAKVMVVIGTKPEHFNAVWVKNEWSRFLSMMKKDRSKLLLPCYRDMDPYDLPEALSVLQSYDMSKIGFMQDLIRGVKKVIDAGKPQEAAKETVKETVVVHNEGGSNVQALLKRGSMALEDGDWGKADEFFEQVLNQDAECGAAYLGKFLAKVKSPSAQKYAAFYIEQVKNAVPTRKNAEVCAEDKAFIEACIQKYQVADYYPAEEIRKALQFDRRYCADRAAYFRNSQKRAEQLLDTDRNFARAEKYASGETKVQCGALRSALADALRQQEQTAAQEAQAEKQRVTEAYRAFLQKTEPKLAAAQSKALAKKQADEESAEAARLAQEAHEREARRTQRAQARAQARKRKALGIAIAALALGIALALVAVKVVIPSRNYARAEQLYAAGEYDAAIALYEKLGRYRDAAERLSRTSAEKEAHEHAQAYADAETMLESGDYDGAAAAFEALGSYQDAEARSADARLQGVYADAVQLQESGDYDGAIAGFTELGAYKDAAGRLNACLYAKADQLARNGDYQEAYLAFAALGAYQDAAERSRDAGAKYFQQLRENYPRPTISAGYEHTVALRNDGTCLVTPYVPSDEDLDSGQCNVSDWTGLVSVSAGFMHTVGLKADGTVLATTVTESVFDYGQSDVSDWTDIVAVAAGRAHTLGLRKDGTVVSTAYRQNDSSNWSNNCGQCNVSGWTDIVAIDAGSLRSVGLKGDGTAVIAGEPVSGGSDISSWENIIAIADGGTHIVGLKADGTVVAVGDNQYGECNVSDWTDIVAIDAEYGFTIGLKADGTVVSTGDNLDGQCNVSNWTDIVAVCAGDYHTVGLKTDGTVVATGWNNDGQCDVSNWTDIKLPERRNAQ